ncbi:glucose transporter [Thraustotheca clavata]|uniref:Hexose transporter 1 n=1 Tax=Thraustotheca clavata TaxID=74557 RepID=A0A1W0AB55_9STRA|nr:glucose transporter [Thraustotheca clavata]
MESQTAYVPAPHTPANKPDTFAPMPTTPKDTVQRTNSTPSLRASRRSTSRIRLSRLEAMLPDDTAAALMPTRVLYITAAVALLGCFQVGWCLMQLNYRPFNLDCAKSPIPEHACTMFSGHSENEWVMAISAWILGAAIGAMCSGAPADKFGRKRTLVLNAIVIMVGAAVQAASVEIYLFSVGRFISGLASGAAINVANALITEISPTHMRGTLGTGIQIFIALGALCVTTCHYFVGFSYGWRFLVGFPLVVSVIQTFLLPFTARSPVWLVSQLKHDDAVSEITRLYVAPVDTKAMLNAMIAAHEEEVAEQAEINAWQALLSKRYRKQLIISVVLCSAQQLCGITAIMYYSSTIFFDAGITDPRVGNTIVNLVRTSGILVASRIMDKVKRRTLLVSGLSAMALAALGVVFSLLYSNPVVSLVSTTVFVGGFSLSIGPMAWMLTAEIFPDFLHAKAGGVGTMTTWIADLLVGLFYPSIAASGAMGNYAFLLFVAFLVGYATFTYIMLPETSHKTSDEIQLLFNPQPVSSPKASGDVYLTMPGSPKEGFINRTSSISHRSSNRSNSRRRLSALEAMIHEDHSRALLPARALYVTILVALIGTFQCGWILSQTNYQPFNLNCNKDQIPHNDCIMFPHHSSNEWTMAVTSWIVGAAIGAMCSGVPADRYGRQRTLYLNAIVMIIGATIQSAATDIYFFSAGRVVSGMAAGAAVNVANVLVSEISPMEMRGLFATGLQVAIALGALAVTTCHYFIGYSYGWRFLVGFPIVLGGLQLFLLPFTAKSPVWLIGQGKNDEALRELNRLYLPCDTATILNAMIASHEELKSETEGVNTWSALFSKKYRKQLVIAVVLCAAQQLCGINAIMYYSSSIFASAGVSDPRVGNTIVNLVRTLGMVLAAKVMDKFHRRTLLIFGMSVMAIASACVSIALVISSPALSLIATAVYVGSFCLSIGSMAWIVAAEIFPDFLHANSGAIGTMFTFWGDFMVGIFYPTLSKQSVLGDYAFLVFVGTLIGFVIFTYFVVPETAQKTFDEIQREFDIAPPVQQPVAGGDHDNWERDEVDEKLPSMPSNETAATVASFGRNSDEDNGDVYLPIQFSPKAGGHKRLSSPSWRASRRHTSRYQLSRLDSMIHEEHSKALIPAPILYVTIIVALMGSFQFGWLMSQLNFRPFDDNCHLKPIPHGDCVMFPGHSENEWTMTVSAWILGGMIGACCSGYPADKFGRQKTLLLNSIVMIIGALVQAISTDIYFFSVGRIISGISSGAAINVCNVLISEISPCQMRGMFATGLQVGVSIGSLVVTTCHYFVGYSYGWRLLVGFPVVLGTVQILLIPLTTKSPVWLIAHADHEGALAELKRLYRPCNTDAIVNALIAAHDEEERELIGINTWRALFSKKYRKQLIIALVLCSAQQLCGINAIMYYSSTIFYTAGVTDPRIGNTVVNLVRTLTILYAARIMDKFKRRVLLLNFMTIILIASVCVVISLVQSISALSIAATAVYMGAFCLSIGPMAWMVTGEIFPDFLHASAGGVGTMLSWVGNMIVGVLYPTLSASDCLGDYAFLIFVGFLVFSILFVYFFVPETGQKTFDEIQKEFNIEPPPLTIDLDVDPWEC